MEPKLTGLIEFLRKQSPADFDVRDLMSEYYEYYYKHKAKVYVGNEEYEKLLKNSQHMKTETDPVEKWYLYKTLDEGRTFPFDCDNSNTTCQLSAEIYEALWSKDVLKHCTKKGTPADDKDKETFIGDTMNSVQTTLKVLTGLDIDGWKKRHGTDTVKKKCGDILVDIISEMNISECLKERLLSGAVEFIRVAHTIGNFIPVPSKTDGEGQSFNKKRSACDANDYWDLTLYYIYRWYKDTTDQKDQWLEKLLLADEKIGKGKDCIVDACKNWLNSFQEKGEPSWDAFVEDNFLQDYTMWTTKPYGCPKEFWDGHFSGPALPRTTEQFKAFFAHATEAIKARSRRMVDELWKRMLIEFWKRTQEQQTK